MKPVDRLIRLAQLEQVRTTRFLDCPNDWLDAEADVRAEMNEHIRVLGQYYGEQRRRLERAAKNSG